jgi:hypothetical protein
MLKNKTGVSRIALLAFALVSMMTAAAVAQSHGSGWATIQQIGTSRDSTGLIQIYSSSPSSTCGDSSYYVMYSSDPNAEEMLTLANAAFLSGREASFWFSGCVTVNGASRPRIWGINIR